MPAEGIPEPGCRLIGLIRIRILAGGRSPRCLRGGICAAEQDRYPSDSTPNFSLNWIHIAVHLWNDDRVSLLKFEILVRRTLDRLLVIERDPLGLPIASSTQHVHFFCLGKVL